MVEWLKNKGLKIIKLFSQRKKKRSSNSKKEGEELKTQQVAKRFCFTALLFFGLQSIIALGGAMELIIPDLPAPITFQDGRSIHLNLSIFWPTFGLMGITYYFFAQEAGVEIYSSRLAKLQYWLFLATGFGILGSLALGYNDGREYLEARFPFRMMILLAILIFGYNLLRTFLNPKAKRRPTVIVMLTGTLSAFLLFAPNLLFFAHPSIDDFVRFWVVHMWEELSFELVGAGVTIALLLTLTDIKRNLIEKLLLLEASLIILTGFLATGHHYYWIGTPSFWIIIGGVFSSFQVLPIIIVFYATLSHLTVTGRVIKNYLVIGFLIASSFWHLTGAGLLGLLLAIPRANLYMHGTLITSSHSHLALFGVFGLLVIGASYYILTKNVKLDKKNRLFGILSFALINFGLTVMGIALFLAGLIQVYLWRVAGMDFMVVQQLLLPYQIARGIGGLIFASGSLLFTWSLISIIRTNRVKIF